MDRTQLIIGIIIVAGLYIIGYVAQADLTPGYPPANRLNILDPDPKPEPELEPEIMPEREVEATPKPEKELDIEDVINEQMPEPTIDIRPSIVISKGKMVSSRSLSTTLYNFELAYIIFNVSITDFKKQWIDFSYHTEDLTANRLEDYKETSGEMAFIRGETWKTVKVPIRNAFITSDEETFRLVINSDDAIVSGPGIGSIQKPDVPLTISASKADVIEGSPESHKMEFIVTLSEPQESRVFVHYETRNLIESEVVDFENLYYDPLCYIHDLIFRPEENCETYEPGITCDDYVYHHKPLYDPRDYGLFGDNATEGLDYDYDSGTLIFDPGETKKTVTVRVFNDTELETDEHFMLALMSPEAENIILKHGIGTIYDTSGPPVLNVKEPAVVEPSYRDAVELKPPYRAIGHMVFYTWLSYPAQKKIEIEFDFIITYGKDSYGGPTGKEKMAQYHYDFDPIFDKLYWFNEGEQLFILPVEIYGDYADSGDELVELQITKNNDFTSIKNTYWGKIIDNPNYDC